MTKKTFHLEASNLIKEFTHQKTIVKALYYIFDSITSNEMFVNLVATAMQKGYEEGKKSLKREKND